jgi:hypothetical protein
LEETKIRKGEATPFARNGDQRVYIDATRGSFSPKPWNPMQQKGK